MKQLFLSTLFLLVALSSWASGTATIDKSNRLSAYWYADRSMTAGSGKDEIHANHLQPGNEGTSSNKVFAINMLATFSSGVVKATTVSNGSLIDVLTIVFDTSLYAQGVKQKGQSGKAYTMTAEEDVVYATYNGTRQPVVRLMDLFNGESGRWAVFENNVFAKDLLNANPVYNSDKSTDAFYTLMTFVDRSNPTPMRIMGDTKFKVRYLRPIDVGLTRNKSYTFKDANEAGYDQLDLAPFVKFYDWRQYDFGYGIISNRSSWMSFYGINGAGVYAEEILCDLDGSINFLHKVAPKINVKVGEGTKPKPSYYYTNDNQRYNAQFLYKMGSLRYQNNGVGVASFNLFVPIHIEHNWGEVIVMVQIPVIGTNSSNYSISWVSDEKLNEYLNYALTKNEVLATGITLNQSNLTLTSAGQTTTLTATVSPSNASDKSVKWISSNPSVVTINSSGVVTAVANGTATITATTADGSNKTATCVVTVTIQTANPDNHYEQVPVQNVEYLQNNQIYTATTERASWYVPAGSNQLQTTKNPTSVNPNPSDQGQQFAFINYQGKYYIYCVGEKKILNGINQTIFNKGKLVTKDCQPVSITETGDTDYPFFFSYGDSYNINIGGSNQITIDSWKTLDEGNKVAIQPVQGATLTQSELNTIIGYIIGVTIDENNTNGYISYIGDPITSVNSIQANSYYLLTSVGRHGSDGQYLYERNGRDLCFEEVTLGHDQNAAFRFEPVGNNQFRIKTTSGNYIPIAQTTGWFTVSADNPGTFLIEPIEGVDDQFTLSCVGTAYYLDANVETASMWNYKSTANHNGAYRIVYCEIERTTAIDNIIDNPERNTDKSVYTIQGQRVTDTRNLRPGVYIIGGKKVLIK